MKRKVKDDPKEYAGATHRATSHVARVKHNTAESRVSDALVRMVIDKMLYGHIEYGYETVGGGWEKGAGDVPALKLNITGAECKLLGDRRNAVQEERLRSMLDSATGALRGYFANSGVSAAKRIVLAQPDLADEVHRRYGAYDEIRLQTVNCKCARSAGSDAPKYEVYVAFPHAVDLPAMQAGWRANHHQFITQLPQLLQMQAAEKGPGAGILGRA